MIPQSWNRTWFVSLRLVADLTAYCDLAVPDNTVEYRFQAMAPAVGSTPLAMIRHRTDLVGVVCNDICHGRTSVLHLNSPVRAKRIQCHGAIVVERVRAVLPVDCRLDTRWVGRVGFVSICGFFKESGVCAVVSALQ